MSNGFYTAMGVLAGAAIIGYVHLLAFFCNMLVG